MDWLITLLFSVFIAIGLIGFGGTIFLLDKQPRVWANTIVAMFGMLLFGFLTAFLVLQLYFFWARNEDVAIEKRTEHYFRYFDKNKDRSIQINGESEAKIGKYNVDKKPFFSKADLNNDGLVTYSEMINLIRKFDYNHSQCIEGEPSRWAKHFLEPSVNELDSIARNGG